MNKSIVTALCLVLVSSASITVSAEPNDTKQFLSPPEVMRLVEESPVAYRITNMTELADVNATNIMDKLFPRSVRPIEFPWRVEKEDGSGEVTEFPFEPGALAMFNEAEAHFVNGRYPDAIRSYQAIIDRFPGCYLAYAHLGDCYFRMKYYDKAIQYFDMAIGLNPWDHRTFLYKADALMGLGRPAEAKEAYIEALVLCPRYWLALANLQHFAVPLGVEVHTHLFQPDAFVRPEPNAVTVYIGDERSIKTWLVYGLVKAIWQAEPAHRQEMLGDAAYKWSSVEETEALLNLIVVYRSLKEQNKIDPDPKLDLLEEIFDAGDLPSFIAYEIASRMCPYITLTFSEGQQKSIREFITKYVVVPAPEQPTAGDGQKVAAMPLAPAPLTPSR